MNKKEERVQMLMEKLLVAELALFNVHLMYRLSEEPQGDCAALVADVWSTDKRIGEPVLMNQGLFLQMGFMSFVWLKESISGECYYGPICDALESKFSVSSTCTKTGCREVKTIKALLKVLRNALGHQRVSVGDGFFTFDDMDDTDCCSITMKWEDFGRLAELFILETRKHLVLKK